MIRGLLLAVLTTVALPVMVLAQVPATTQHEHGASQAPAPNQSQQQLMQMHQKMMADMAAMDQKLDGLVTQMNAAQGQAKVDAMAAVISEMINQQKQMREHMASMMGQGGMIGGMMGGRGPGMMMGTSGGMMSGAASTFDPVCRARIADNRAPTATYQGKTYQFCSEADKQAFLKNPEKYVSAPR